MVVSIEDIVHVIGQQRNQVVIRTVGSVSVPGQNTEVRPRSCALIRWKL